MRVFQVDVFTRERFRGNAAGVVVGADGLDAATMQAIARELNNSETAFLFEPQGDDHDVFIRYFTPTVEVPTCGHATIAAHFVRATLLQLPTGVVWQKSGIGILPIDVVACGSSGYRVWMNQKKPELSEPLEIEDEVCRALRIDPRELDDRLPLQVVTTGAGKIMVPIRRGAVLDSLQPDLPAVAALTTAHGANGIFAFTFDTPRHDVLTSCRMFAPAIGIPEDPVTGNGNGPLGAYLVHHRFLYARDGKAELRSLQGLAMGRPGIARVQVAVRDGEIERVRVGDEAVIAFEATFVS